MNFHIARIHRRKSALVLVSVMVMAGLVVTGVYAAGPIVAGESLMFFENV